MINLVYNDLSATKDLIYSPCNFTISQLLIEKECSEYGACKFQLNSCLILFRVAKITPKKSGQFVTFWKRTNKGPIQPYDSSDTFDFLVICTPEDSNFGQFVFPKSALLTHGVLSKNGTGGKRAFRVYPPWTESLNSQALKTQKWQLDYFLSVPLDEKIDTSDVKKLYSQV